MKEMMIKLPMIEMAATADAWQAKHYPKSGRYIIRRDNGDISVADVQMKEIEIGEARCDDERLLSLYETFVGQPELFDPYEWVLAIDVESKIKTVHAELERTKAKMQHDCDKKCEAMQQEHDATVAGLKKEVAELRMAMARSSEKFEKEYNDKRTELEHEYELRQQALDLTVPKRFGQGEWVSGKTLAEIIKTLAGKKEE